MKLEIIHSFVISILNLQVKALNVKYKALTNNQMKTPPCTVSKMVITNKGHVLPMDVSVFCMKSFAELSIVT